MDIHSRISEALVACKMATGRDPVNVYLGRDETTELMQWAYDNQYVNTPSRDDLEGEKRPEVQGLFVFEVNADTHLVCA